MYTHHTHAYHRPQAHTHPCHTNLYLRHAPHITDAYTLHTPNLNAHHTTHATHMHATLGTHTHTHLYISLPNTYTNPTPSSGMCTTHYIQIRHMYTIYKSPTPLVTYIPHVCNI